MAITGAAKTAPQLALETVLNLPTLDTFIQSEARITAFRFRECITKGRNWNLGHGSALCDLYNHAPFLQAPVDRCSPRYVFGKSFRYRLRDPAEGQGEETNPHIDKWFTDASVNKHGSGYGIYHANSGRELCGYLGVNTDITQAELAAIHICACEIAKGDYGNSPIEIYSDSLGAVKAISSYKIESKLVMDCCEALNKLAQNRHTTLIWIKGHSDSLGNLKADLLAKRGASNPTPGPEPFLSLKEKKCREICDSWSSNMSRDRWRSANTCSHTKEFVAFPQKELTNKLLTLNKLDMSITISIITGHIRLNAYLNKIGIRDDPDCDYCGRAPESAKHFLCACTGLSHLRNLIFNKEFLSPDEVMSFHAACIANFVKQSGRFQTLASRHPSTHTHRQVDGGTAINTITPTPTNVEN